MKEGRPSRTALKVAHILLIASHDPELRDGIPEGAGPLTERLLLASKVPPYGPWLLGAARKPWTRRMSARAERRTPGAYTGLVERKRFMNEQVLAALEAGATQVCLVGAGFDTLCLRLAPRYPDRRFFELDHPATGAAKARGLAEVGKPANLEQLLVDLGARPLEQVLAEHPSWDTGATSVFVAEGLFMYLSRPQVSAFFRQCAASSGPRSRLAFSHLLDLDRTGPLAKLALSLMGEPWLSDLPLGEVEAFAAGLGWRMLAQYPADPRALEGFAAVEKHSAQNAGSHLESGG
ncbi:hypothetical protein PPSIR1_24529 [Plesiocystis pacifica SIR-1]|uniref:S-adenosyl-L-methionine-dependent methyltransferase n=1 Tax=Plesiocystis pacifica SIR-1 TaxID=391625 RepID=A6GGW2_9BACT|nr:SAM-dependent methyltransferase [Plesiocystis pacifica]EDM74903.1 hypothetical protein PPSIR1_24529 [Plesiocystis pacifica SIR-1]